MLNIQKSVSDKTRLGFIEKGSSFVVHPPKFVHATSSFIVHPSVSEVKVHKEEVLASRRIRVDLSESKPRNPNQSGSKKHHKPYGFVTFVVWLGILGQIALSCKLQSMHPNKKCMCQKHKILWHSSMNW